MASNKNNVIGFHYEPELSDTDAVSGPEYDSESGNEGEEACVQGRRAASVEEWCQCHKCEKMASEQECVCCHEIDEIKYFKLGGKKQYQHDCQYKRIQPRSQALYWVYFTM